MSDPSKDKKARIIDLRGPLVTTKAELRGAIRDMLRMHRAADVPDDGLAEILAQWTVGHLNGGTKVKA